MNKLRMLWLKHFNPKKYAEERHKQLLLRYKEMSAAMDDLSSPEWHWYGGYAEKPIPDSEWSIGCQMSKLPDDLQVIVDKFNEDNRKFQVEEEKRILGIANKLFPQMKKYVTSVSGFTVYYDVLAGKDISYHVENKEWRIVQLTGVHFRTLEQCLANL